MIYLLYNQVGNNGDNKAYDWNDAAKNTKNIQDVQVEISRYVLCMVEIKTMREELRKIATTAIYHKNKIVGIAINGLQKLWLDKWIGCAKQLLCRVKMSDKIS